MATFKVEAEEYVKGILNGIEMMEVMLEDGKPTDLSAIEHTYRQFHSLKGAAQAVGFDQVGQLCQKAESVLARWKANANDATIEDLHEIFENATLAAKALNIKYDSDDELLDGNAPSANAASSPVSANKDTGNKTAAPEPNSNAKAPSKDAAESKDKKNKASENSAQSQLNQLMSLGTSPGSETVRISSDKLDSLLRRGEQLVLARFNSLLRWTEAQNLLNDMMRTRQRLSKRNANLTPEEQEMSDASYRFINEMHRLVRNLSTNHHELDTQLQALLAEVKRARLAPVRPLMEDLEMAARRIARQLGKKVRIEVFGNELELDRSIMEALKDPLIHLVRNALDHGLETPEERAQVDKPIEGHLTIGIRAHGTSTMEFIVADDGRGIQTEEVIEAAKRQGLIADGVAVDSLDLIFSSGVSTRRQVSNISGRGLGMAIVRDKVEALKGSIRVKTHIGEGTTFELSMPTSIATFNGLLIKEYDREMVVPLNGVEAVAQFRSSDICSVEGSQVVKFRDTIIPLSRLGRLLKIPEYPGHINTDPCQAIIVTAGGRKAAFLLDEINGVHEVLSHDLGPQLKKLRFIIGACMVGYQNVVPVLNVADLLTFVRGAAPGNLLNRQKPVQRVLVADDSLTTRTLMRSILEGANYAVEQAVDGDQAWDMLLHDNYDLLVSDVDMPGMTGLDLTIKIRTHNQLNKLPIILVTGQERQEDRQRGLNLGANAYLLKSRFDEGVLLETVESLIGEARTNKG